MPIVKFCTRLRERSSTKKRQKLLVEALHQKILEKALEPYLYQGLSVPDSFDGRFEMATLFSTLIMRRLRDLDESGQALAQDLFEHMFDSFDDDLRETGVGDMSIAKKMRKMGEAFYGRAQSYDVALKLKEPDEELAKALARNIWNEVQFDKNAVKLASVAILCKEALDEYFMEDFVHNRWSWTVSKKEKSD